MSEKIFLTKKNARIVRIEDGTFVIYTYDPETNTREKFTFDNYEAAQAKGREFMEFKPNDNQHV